MKKAVIAGVIVGVNLLSGIMAYAHEEIIDLRITDDRVEYRIIENGAHVSVEYPVLNSETKFSAEMIDAVNEEFRNIAEETSEQAAKDMNEAYSWCLEIGDQELASHLTYEVTCDSVYILNHAYSVMQSHYTYTGGAHPYSWKEGYTYDMNTGELMTMGEILGCSEETAVEAVVLAYKDTIIGQIEEITEESIREAFDDMEYWFDEEGLRVSIAPYIVASFAAGPQDVLVTQDYVAKAYKK